MIRIVCTLFLAFTIGACAEKNEKQNPPPAVANGDIPVDSGTQELPAGRPRSEVAKKQIIQVQDVAIEVTTISTVSAMTDKFLNLEESLFLIKTPTQTLSYRFDAITGKGYSELSPEQMARLENYKGKIVHVDLKIDQMKESYGIFNALDLSRCQIIKLMPELLRIFKAKRKSIYFKFGLSGLSNIFEPSHFLKWSTEMREFQGMVQVARGREGSDRGEPYIAADPLLVPNHNVYGQNLDLIEDNMFLDPGYLGWKCGEIYSKYAASRPEQQHLQWVLYQPSRDSQFENENALMIEAKFADFDHIFWSTGSIYTNYFLKSEKRLKNYVLEYARSHPLYQELN